MVLVCSLLSAALVGCFWESDEPSKPKQMVDATLANGPFNAADETTPAANGGGAATPAPAGSGASAPRGSTAGSGASPSGAAGRAPGAGGGGPGASAAGRGAGTMGGAAGGGATPATPATPGGSSSSSGSSDWYCQQAEMACSCVPLPDGVDLTSNCTEPLPTCCYFFHTEGATDSCVCWPDGSAACEAAGASGMQWESTDRCPP